MPIRIGPPELILIMLILILLFGAGRIGRLAGELGKGIRDFRTALEGDKEDDKKID
jgi:sec-independent protein translocase protein TatA